LTLGLLVSCGGSSNQDHAATGGVSRVVLHLTSAALSGGNQRAVVAGQTRQANAVARLTVLVDGPGISTPITADCPLAALPTAQCRRLMETAQILQLAVELLVPTGPARRIVVTAFDAFRTPTFRDERTVDIDQADVVVELALQSLPQATATDLENRAFAFLDGTIFGLDGQTVMLAFGAFAGQTAPMALSTAQGAAHGLARLATIEITLEQSDLAGLPAGSTFVFEATVNPDESLNLRNRATEVSHTSRPPVAATGADLRVEKHAVAAVVVQGETLTYVVTVTNNGPEAVTEAVLTDTGPAGLRFSAVASTQGGCSIVESTVRCALGGLAQGRSATVTITAIPGTAGGLTNSASVLGSAPDPLPGNNTATATTTVIAMTDADLVVSKVGVPDPSGVGEPLTYLLTVTNNGPAVATGIVFTDILPAEVVFESVVTTQGSCSQQEGRVHCDLSTLSRDASARVTIVVTPTAAGPITNMASVVSNEPDPIMQNNATATTVTVSAATSADVAVSAAAAPDPVGLAESLTYLITVTNNGPAMATGVTLVDTLPREVAVNSVVSSQGHCETLMGQVSCALDSLSRGRSATVTINVTPLQLGTVTNMASVLGAEEDPNTANNTHLLNTAVALGADIAVRQQATPTPVAVGTPLTYLLTVTNHGPAVATEVALNNALPIGVTFHAAVTTQGSCDHRDGRVQCALGALARDASATVTITVTPQTVGTLINAASVTRSGTDPNGSNNTDVHVTRATAATDADLALSRVETPAVAALDAPLTILLTITNHGPAMATDVVLTDALPVGVTLDAAVPSQGSCNPADGRVSCALGALAPGASATVAVVVTPTALGTLFNSASVRSPTNDPIGENNTATTTITVSPATAAEVVVDKVAIPESVMVGESLTYLITVTNQGPATATDVELTETLPASVTLSSVTPSQGSCSALQDNRVTCALGSLAPRTNATVTLSVTPTAPERLTNTASVTSTAADPNGANNTLTRTTTVSTGADLAVRQEAMPDPVSVGEALTYLATVTNQGPGTATGVALTQALPAGVTVRSVTSSQGECGEVSDSRVMCTLGSLLRGASATVTAAVIPTTAGRLLSTTSVAGNDSDPSSGNNTVTIVTVAGASTDTDLAVRQEATPNPVSVGEALTYLVTATNHGPATATGVELTHALPTGVTAPTATPSQGECGAVSDSRVVCMLGNLAPDTSATLTVVVTPTVAGTLTSTASVHGETNDPAGANNAMTIMTTASAQTDVDLESSQFATSDVVLAGQPLAYVITVSNRSPNVATDVLLTSTLPAEVLFAAATPLGLCSAADGTVQCRLGTLPGNTATIVTLVVVPTGMGTLVHPVRVQGNEPDPIPQNNTSTVTVMALRDTDRDGLADDREAALGTDPLTPDTDGDGLRDGVETNTGVFVSLSDTGTDPRNPDTDGDNVTDSAEVAACTLTGSLYPGALLDTAAGFGIRTLVVADVNGDGRPDLLTPVRAPADLSVALGCGDGTFRALEFLNAGNPPVSFPVAVVTADLNSDGMADLVTANAGFNTEGTVVLGNGVGEVTVLLGHGDGTFQQVPLTFPAGDAPLGLATADVDGDQQADLITADAGTDTVSVLLSNGNGTLQSPLSFATGTRPVAVVVADVNGDGLPDIITANSGSDNVAVLLGAAGSLVQPARFFQTGAGPAAVTVADVNGDSRLDLITANCGFSASQLQCTSTDDRPGDVTVLLGDGQGNFQPPISVGAGIAPLAVAVADVSGDARPDLIVADYQSRAMAVLHGDGLGAFASPQFLATGGPPVAVAAVDLNADSAPDIVAANEFGGALILLGNTDGTLQTRRLFSPGAFLDPRALAVADVDRDGVPDLVTANSDAFSVSVLHGMGDGNFQTPQIFSVGNFPVAVTAADVNGDSVPDIITANSASDDVSVLPGQMEGTFAEALSFAAGDGPVAVAVADVNGDGLLDLVVANSDSDDVSLLLGDRATPGVLFQSQQRFTAGVSPVAVAVADVNGDGLLDLVVANSDSDDVSLLLGDRATPGVLFQSQQRFSVAGSPFAVVLADVNDDANLDLITANANTNEVAVLLGDGTGTAFSAPQRFFAGSGVHRMVVADVNGDARPDLIAANSFSAGVAVLLGNGDGTLQPPRHFLVGNGPRDVAVADVNGDTLPDIIAIPEGVVSVLLHR
jgi:uncharacterized repeat protein (TIGR01451 family)